MWLSLPLSPKLRSLGQQFLKFGAVGAGGVVVHFVMYLSLTRGFPWWREHFLLANFIAFMISNAHNFLWHRHWTFAASHLPWLKQYLSFLGISSFYLAFLQGSMWVLVKVFGWHDVVSLVASLCVGVSLYFMVVRRFIFRTPAAPAAS